VDVLGEFTSKVREFALPSGVITLESMKELGSLLRWASYVVVREDLARQLKPTLLELVGKAEAFVVMFIRSYVTLVAREFNVSDDFEGFKRQISRYRPYVDGILGIARDVRMLAAAVGIGVSRDFDIASDVFSRVLYAIESARDSETFRNLFMFAIGGTPYERFGRLKKAVPDMKVYSPPETGRRKPHRLIGPFRPLRILKSILSPLRIKGHR